MEPVLLGCLAAELGDGHDDSGEPHTPANVEARTGFDPERSLETNGAWDNH